MLDPKGRREVMSIAKELNRQGITIINITHNMEEAVISDRVIVLRKGRIVIDAPPKDAFASGLVEACGLTLPPALQVAEDLKTAGFEFPSQILFEEELVEGVCLQLK